jgi:hypothetical protein
MPLSTAKLTVVLALFFRKSRRWTFGWLGMRFSFLDWQIERTRIETTSGPSGKAELAVTVRSLSFPSCVLPVGFRYTGSLVVTIVHKNTVAERE